MVRVSVCHAQSVRVHIVKHDAFHINLHVLCNDTKSRSNILVGEYLRKKKNKTLDTENELVIKGCVTSSDFILQQETNHFHKDLNNSQTYSKTALICTEDVVRAPPCTYLCRSLTSQTTWWSPGCCSSSSPCLAAAAPAEPAAPSAPSAAGPSAAPRARPAPAASAVHTERKYRHGVSRTPKCTSGSRVCRSNGNGLRVPT